jgi:hypothetical protein
MVGMIVSGVRALSEDVVYRIERNYHQVNINWLLNGTGEMLKPSKQVDPLVLEISILKTELAALQATMEQYRQALEDEREGARQLRQIILNLSKD